MNTSLLACIKDNDDDNTMRCFSASFQSYSVDKRDYYLSIYGENSLGFFNGLMSVNCVMDRLYPEKKIDWELVPSSYLCSLFIQNYTQILLSFSSIPFLLRVEDIYLGQSVNGAYPKISSDLGDVFIREIKGHFQWIALSNNKLGVIGDFCLGTSQLSLSLLKNILLGDVLLIEKISSNLFLGEKKWIKFEWNGENSVQLLNENESKVLDSNEQNKSAHEIESQPFITDEEKRLAPIGNIPVTVSFILASKKLLIEEIENLKPGQHIMLPEEAHQQIILKVNGLSVAQGELIRVGDRLAVEIQRSFSHNE
ncbi:FliM/FliN family flagellar motor switch protein [Proteus vulgaris]|uniref:FliM/FliN family flagellar motor switch protein n=1 Tax=Proteus vulgaris TaxID=585 RepID=UPI0023622008|nr:FliM/FliN family flagellar motor switch protein [Proteus vulgaris]